VKTGSSRSALTTNTATAATIPTTDTRRLDADGIVNAWFQYSTRSSIIVPANLWMDQEIRIIPDGQYFKATAVLDMESHLRRVMTRPSRHSFLKSLDRSDDGTTGSLDHLTRRAHVDRVYCLTARPSYSQSNETDGQDIQWSGCSCSIPCPRFEVPSSK